MNPLELARRRRSARSFSGDPVPLHSILYAIEVALKVPSKANQQPLVFIIFNDPEIEGSIRFKAHE